MSLIYVIWCSLCSHGTAWASLTQADCAAKIHSRSHPGMRLGMVQVLQVEIEGDLGKSNAEIIHRLGGNNANLHG